MEFLITKYIIGIFIVLMVFVIFELIFRQNRGEVESKIFNISSFVAIFIFVSLLLSTCGKTIPIKNPKDMTNKEYQEYKKWNKDYDKRQWENQKRNID